MMKVYSVLAGSPNLWRIREGFVEQVVLWLLAEMKDDESIEGG